ncbi:hypothetical protein EME01_61240 [Sinorhizobium meliloti]|nr:hypothetical protein EME01_61240 [Sinorhizobium meliloti]
MASLELRGKFASDLLICNLHATVDDDVGSVAMRVPRSSIWIERHKRAAEFWLAEDYFTGAKCIGVI